MLQRPFEVRQPAETVDEGEEQEDDRTVRAPETAHPRERERESHQSPCERERRRVLQPEQLAQQAGREVVRDVVAQHGVVKPCAVIDDGPAHRDEVVKDQVVLEIVRGLDVEFADAGGVRPEERECQDERPDPPRQRWRIRHRAAADIEHAQRRHDRDGDGPHRFEPSQHKDDVRHEQIGHRDGQEGVSSHVVAHCVSSRLVDLRSFYPPPAWCVLEPGPVAPPEDRLVGRAPRPARPAACRARPQDRAPRGRDLA